jgi:hypothetical protein
MATYPTPESFAGTAKSYPEYQAFLANFGRNAQTTPVAAPAVLPRTTGATYGTQTPESYVMDRSGYPAFLSAWNTRQAQAQAVPASAPVATPRATAAPDEYALSQPVQPPTWFDRPIGAPPNSTDVTGPSWAQRVFAGTPLESAAGNAASAATAKALRPDPNVPFESGYQDTPYRAPVTGPTDAWNAHVAAAQGRLSAAGYTVPSAVALAARPQVAFDKAAGEAAVQAGGAPRLLNYGYGTDIIGSGRGVGGKFNSFTGVGQGAQAAGAAGVLGERKGPMSPMDRYNDLIEKVQALSGKGSIAAGLTANKLLRQATAIHGAFMSEQQAAMMARHQQLQEAIAGPGITAATGLNALIGTRNFEEARQSQAARAGAQTVQDIATIPGIIPGSATFVPREQLPGMNIGPPGTQVPRIQPIVPTQVQPVQFQTPRRLAPLSYVDPNDPYAGSYAHP